MWTARVKKFQGLHLDLPKHCDDNWGCMHAHARARTRKVSRLLYEASITLSTASVRIIDASWHALSDACLCRAHNA